MDHIDSIKFNDLKKYLLSVDIETSGLDFSKNQILSIGAVYLEDPSKYFEGNCQIGEGMEVNESVLEINDHTYAKIMDPKRQTLSELLESFSEWVEDISSNLPKKSMIMVCQNPQFDLGFIETSYQKLGKRLPVQYRAIDLHTATICKLLGMGARVPLKNGRPYVSGNSITKFVGIGEEPMHHNALRGAKYVAESLHRLWYNKKLLGDFEDMPVPEYLSLITM